MLVERTHAKQQALKPPMQVTQLIEKQGAFVISGFNLEVQQIVVQIRSAVELVFRRVAFG